MTPPLRGTDARPCRFSVCKVLFERPELALGGCYGRDGFYHVSPVLQRCLDWCRLPPMVATGQRVSAAPAARAPNQARAARTRIVARASHSGANAVRASQGQFYQRPVDNCGRELNSGRCSARCRNTNRSRNRDVNRCNRTSGGSSWTRPSARRNHEANEWVTLQLCHPGIGGPTRPHRPRHSYSHVAYSLPEFDATAIPIEGSNIPVPARISERPVDDSVESPANTASDKDNQASRPRVNAPEEPSRDSTWDQQQQRVSHGEVGSPPK